MNRETIKCLKWLAQGYETDVTDSDGDTYGQECVFEDCDYNTTTNKNQHSETCLRTIARKELKKIDRSLRKYIITFNIIHTPTDKLKRNASFYNLEQPKIAIHPQERTIYTTEKFRLDVSAFIEKELNSRKRNKENWVSSIDPQSIVINDPEFLEE